MRSLRNLSLLLAFLLLTVSPSFALKGVLSTPEDMARLRRDLKAGNLHAGITRLSEVIDQYGEPLSKTDTDKKVTLEYGDFKIEFTKNHFWREWGFDSFKKPAYTDKIKLLRQRLEGQKIVGENIPVEKFYKDYDEPTEIFLTPDDGEISVYYYGDMRLTFENVFTLKSWEAKRLDDPGIEISGARATIEPAVAAVTVNPPATASPTQVK